MMFSAVSYKRGQKTARHVLRNLGSEKIPSFVQSVVMYLGAAILMEERDVERWGMGE